MQHGSRSCTTTLAVMCAGAFELPEGAPPEGPDGGRWKWSVTWWVAVVRGRCPTVTLSYHAEGPGCRRRGS